MDRTMKVAKLVDVKEMGIFEENRPKPGSGEVLVKLKVSGICGSDLHYFLEGGLGTFRAKLPMRMGHEPSGIVEDPGRSTVFSKRDRVAIDPNRPCGECESCARGLHNLCRNASFMGANDVPGAFQEYIVVSEKQLVRLEDWMTYEEGAMLEPFGVAYHSVNLAKFRLGAKVAIFGSGPIGLSILAAAKMAGAGETFIVDKLGYRLQVAQSLYRADHIIEEGKEDPVSYVLDATNGLGVDAAFDAAGMQNTVDGCLKTAACGGKVVLVGIPTYDYLTYNPHIARIKELAIFNVRRSNQTLPVCLDLLKARAMTLKEVVTHRYPLESIQEAFEVAGGYKDGVIKAVIQFD